MRNGRSRSLYLSIRMVIRQAVVIGEEYQFFNYVQNFIQRPMQQVNY